MYIERLLKKCDLYYVYKKTAKKSDQYYVYRKTAKKIDQYYVYRKTARYKNILTGFEYLLKSYTWRHNQVLLIILKRYCEVANEILY